MNVVIIPVLLPLLTGLVGPFFGRRMTARRRLVMISVLLQCGLHAALVWQACVVGPLVLWAGDWPAPLGITLVIDPLSAVMLLLTSLAVLAVLAHDFASTPAAREHPLRLPLVQFLSAGLSLGFITGDLFNLFVAFEIVLTSSYALLTLEAGQRTIRAALPYVTINILGGVVLLAGTAIAYALFGTLNFADLALRAGAMAGDPRIAAWAMLLLFAFGLKMALVPVFFWLPPSYPVLPPALGALFAATLTKIGAYALLRSFAGMVPPDTPLVFSLLRVLAAVAIVVGAVGALSRRTLREILAFLIIGQLGFVALALGFPAPRATTAAIFLLWQEIPAIAALFLIAATLAARPRPRHAKADERRSVWQEHPWFAAAFLCQGLSLAGVPPFSGFWGKYVILDTAVDAGAPGLIACVLAGSLLTLIVVLRVWLHDFWSEADTGEPGTARATPTSWRPLAWSSGALTVLSLLLGLGAEGTWRLAEAAATALLDQETYQDLILPEAARLP